MSHIQNVGVQAVFDSYPAQYQQPLLVIRDLIFNVASQTHGVGRLTETLKWGQPSYLTEETKSGTTIRLDRFGQSQIGLFFHCQTTLINTFRVLFPELNYSKNRAIILQIDEALPIDALRICIEMALTYQLKKKQ